MGPKKLVTVWPVKVPFLRPLAVGVEAEVGAGELPLDGGAPEGVAVAVETGTEDELGGGGTAAVLNELEGGVRKLRARDIPTPMAAKVTAARAAMAGSSGEKREALEVGLAGGDLEGAQAAHDRVDHPPGTADEDISLPQVRGGRDQESGRKGVNADLVATAPDDVMDHPTARRDQLVKLGLEDHVLPGTGAVEEGYGVLPLRHLLDQCTRGSDADAPGDQQRSGTPPSHRREDAIGALQDDSRSGPEAMQRAGEVAHLLDGDAEVLAVGRRRKREGMDLPPETARQEAEFEELAGAHRELGQGAAFDVDGDHIRSLLDDRVDPQTVACRHSRGGDDAERDHQGGGDRVQRHPVAEREAVVDEVGACGQLVGETQRDRQVNEEVDEMPALVGES